MQNRNLLESRARSILNIGNDFDEILLKKKYRELIKQNHPDVGGDTQRMQIITEAYSYLKNHNVKGIVFLQDWSNVCDIMGDELNEIKIPHSFNGKSYEDWWRDRFYNVGAI